MRTSTHLFLAAALSTIIPLSAHAQSRRPVVAIFAHPDDERVIGPLLSRLAREGRETHLVIATDGARGVTPFARIPTGEAFAVALLFASLLFASLPSERLRTAPPAKPTVNGTTEALLTVRVPFEAVDLVARREEFTCHRTQYTPTQMDAANRYLAHAGNGTVCLRPWNGSLHDAGLFRPSVPRCCDRSRP